MQGETSAGAPLIRRLDALSMREWIAALSAILIDCVEGGASVSFMHPMTRQKADAFWLAVQARVEAGMADVLVAEIDGETVGTVQVVAADPENQPHRADVAKMLVHRRARRRGVGQALMTAAEDVARSRGKTLLVLDTADPGAERLYRRQNWIPVGRVPGYALLPDGRPCDTVILYKALVPETARPGVDDPQI